MGYSELIERQRAYFTTGATRPYEYRRAALRSLRTALKSFEQRIYDALREDLNKQEYETYLTELGLVYGEIGLYERKLRGWMRDRRAKSGIAVFPTRSVMSPEPYGVVLIVTPWNYPVNLCLMPLIGAIAAGNCVVLKNSSKCPHTGAVLAEMLASAFPEEHIAVVNAAREECGDLLGQKWDYIFFTGSKDGGREVMRAAAEHIVPYTLELGGKNPAIVDPTADLALAARRIAFGKCLNAGQTCIAPDYALIHESVRDAFIEEYEKALKKFFPKGDMSDMVCIVSDAHFKRITGLMEGETVALGGETDPARRFIAPTVLKDVAPDAPIMQEEIFGPVLPILTWTALDRCVDFIHTYDKPLSLYLFTQDDTIVQRVLRDCSFGGGCVNETILHISSSDLGFGGVGPSGIGQYHGKRSFDTFTHYRAVMFRKKFPEQRMRYFPYGKLKLRLLRLFIR